MSHLELVKSIMDRGFLKVIERNKYLTKASVSTLSLKSSLKSSSGDFILPQLIALSVQRAISPSSSITLFNGFVGRLISQHRFDCLIHSFVYI